MGDKSAAAGAEAADEARERRQETDADMQQQEQQDQQQRQQQDQGGEMTTAASAPTAMSDEGENKFVVVVNAKENKPMHSALVNVLNLETKVVEQQFLVSRNKENQLLLRELPGLVRGIVFTTASVIQHHQNKSKLIFLFTSKRSDLPGKYVFRITADGSFVDSELAPTSMQAVHALLDSQQQQQQQQESASSTTQGNQAS